MVIQFLVVLTKITWKYKFIETQIILMSGGRVTLDRVKSWEYDDVDNKFAIKDLDKS